VLKAEGSGRIRATGEAVGRVLRVVISSCIREPVEVALVLEF
jgi:hypothetical protein